MGVAAQQYSALKPILRNNDSAQLNITNLVTPTAAAALPYNLSRQRRTKSATKYGRTNRRANNMSLQQPMTIPQQY